MTAVSRWVEFSVSSTTTTSNGSNACVGKRGGVKGNVNYPGDAFTIVAGSNDELAITMDNTESKTIQLDAGTSLDPRFIARNVSQKIQVASANARYKNGMCEWRNNKFYIWSGTFGSTSFVDLGSATNDAKNTLGFTSPTRIGNAPADPTPYYQQNNNAYDGTCTASGTYLGQFDDLYTVVASYDTLVANGTASGTNTYTGTFTTGGAWNGYNNYNTTDNNAYTTNDTYTITVSTASGTLLNGGRNNVPTITWTSSQGDNSTYALELLYSDNYYEIGTKGLMCRWSDAAFGNGDVFTVACTASTRVTVGGATSAQSGTAEVVWSSLRGDNGGSVTTSTTSTTIGTKGVRMAWSGGAATPITKGDEFRVLCIAPKPTNINLTNLNFGNVTVSTNSSVKALWFELVSGAYIMSSVKFSLQSHGTFSHHDAGNSDTEFHFGTAGAGNPASNGTEWRASVTATDISSDSPPAYLYATAQDLAVVASADDAEDVGNVNGALVSDWVWLAIKLGASETGTNSSVNLRIFFDYS